MTIVLKIGGSVITDKGGHEDLDRDTMEPLLDTLAGRDHDIVLVHGAGSFGHPHAADAGIDTSKATREATDITTVHRAVRQLNDHVIDSLHDRGEDAIGLHPSSMLTRQDGLTGTTDPVQAALASGLTPVLHGDIVLQDDGAAVLSGDELVPYLAAELDARAGIISDVPGILDRDGTVIPVIDSPDGLADHGGPDDTSGGMEGKVRTILSYDVPVRILGPADCEAFLTGEPVGTLVGHQR